MATQTVAGKAPLTFTDSTAGAERSVPLSALEVSGSTIVLAQGWDSVFSAQDTQILLAIANAKFASGELTAPPASPPQQAIVFTAAVAGPEGNDITVSVTPYPDSGPVTTSSLLINATETDTYSGMTDGGTGPTGASTVIGVDVATPGGPPAGTGVVAVKSPAPKPPPGLLPKDKQSLKVKGDTPVVATDGSTILFTLVPRAGYQGTAGIPVTVTLDADGTTFTVTVNYDPANTTKIPATQISSLPQFSSLPKPVAYIVTAQAPPRGLAAPAAGTQTITLSGGAPGIPASGVVYTS